jgi:hypothetical protein
MLVAVTELTYTTHPVMRLPIASKRYPAHRREPISGYPRWMAATDLESVAVFFDCLHENAWAQQIPAAREINAHQILGSSVVVVAATLATENWDAARSRATTIYRARLDQALHNASADLCRYWAGRE